jgi:hypothetical protein
MPLVWLDAGVGVTVSSGKATQWIDRSSHAWTFAPRNSGNRPAWSSTGWNGTGPAVKFGSSYTEMINQQAGLGDLGTSLKVRVYAIWDIASHASTQKLVTWVNNAGSSGVYEMDVNSSHNEEIVYSSGGDVRTGTTLTGKHVSTFVINQHGTGYSLSYIDGVLDISTTSAVPTAATDTMVIGGNIITGSAALDAYLAELVVYDCSSADYDANDKFRHYAQTKWGGLP